MSDRFLVGTGAWTASNTAIWSTTDGGAPGASVPTSSDNVFFTLLSGPLTVTIATDAANCANLDCTGYLGTLAGSTTALNIYGSMTLASGMTMSFTAALNFLSTSTGRTLTFAGKTTNSVSTFSGVGGGWTLVDEWNNTLKSILPTGVISSFNSNGQKITCGAFTINSGITVTLGASSIFCTSWSCGSGTNLSALSSIISVTGTSAFGSGGKSYGIVNISTTVDTTISTMGCSFINLSLKNSSGYVNFTLPTAITISNPDWMGNNNSTQRISVGSQSTITTAVVTCNGSVSLLNVDLAGITIAGSATWSGTSVGNAGNNVGAITYTAPVNRYWVQNASSQDFVSSGRWSATSGGTVGASFPLPQDTANIDASSIPTTAYTITCTQTNMRMPNINFTGATNSPTFSPATPRYCGNLTLISAMTYSPTGVATFFGGNSNLTSAGKTHGNITISCSATNTLTLLDNLTTSGPMQLSTGIFNENNFNVTAPSFSSTAGAGVRTLTMGSGITEMTSTASVWNFSGATPSNVTINPGSSTIKFTNNSASSKSFFGIGKTWNNFWNATSGAGVTITQDSSVFNDFKIDAARTQQFTAGTNTTFKSLTATGTLGNLVTIQSVTSAAHTLTHIPVSLAVRFVSCDYLNLSYSTASPANSFYAGANSTNSGNNTGWIFTVPPVENIKTINGNLLSVLKNRNGISAGATKSFSGII